MTPKAIGWLFSACVLTTGCGFGGEDPPSDPVARKIYDRQQNFKEMGRDFKVIDDQLKERYPDFDVIQAAALRMQELGSHLPEWFEEGTGPESGFETDAKAEIWQDKGKFESVYQEFTVEMDRLVASAGLADKNAMVAQYHTAGVSCSNCHKPFRVEDD